MRIVPLFASVAVILACAQAPEQAMAQEGPAVVQVIQVDTGGNMAKFMELSAKIGAVNEKYGSTGERRILQSTLAGPNTGTVFVVIEYPSFVSMAESVSKVNASPEFAQLVAEAQAAGLSIVSNSVSVDINPDASRWEPHLAGGGAPGHFGH